MIKQRGVSLYLALVILAAITAALFALITISISQTKIIWTIGDSVTAFYAADTGIERVLYKIYKEPWDPGPTSFCPFPAWQSLSVNAEYKVCVSDTSTSTIWSTGNHIATKTKRKIEINFK